MWVANDELTEMIAEKFVAFEVGVVEGVLAEENSRVFIRGGVATEGADDGVSKPLFGDALDPLGDGTVAAIPGKGHHNHLPAASAVHARFFRYNKQTTTMLLLFTSKIRKVPK